MTMENQGHTIEALFEQAVEYGQTRAELAVLKTIDRVSDELSSAASHIVAWLAWGFAFLIVNIGLCLFLGEALGKVYYGFFMLAGFYSFMGIIFYLLRHTFIKTMVCNAIISHTFK